MFPFPTRARCLQIYIRHIFEITQLLIWPQLRSFVFLKGQTFLMFEFTKLRTFEGVKQGKLHGLKRKFIFKALMLNKVVVDPFPDLHFIKRERKWKNYNNNAPSSAWLIGFMSVVMWPRFYAVFKNKTFSLKSFLWEMLIKFVHELFSISHIRSFVNG